MGSRGAEGAEGAEGGGGAGYAELNIVMANTHRDFINSVFIIVNLIMV